ncbi:hypothetical protein [Vibrio intestinalis]|uniref:hypothetical protein n=1 Tax=Vibrio intestinalis TaxID=2933291 RepID=UPI0021A65B9A|nr:hypothetical protein [Vibrio intestinalis]
MKKFVLVSSAILALSGCSDVPSSAKITGETDQIQRELDKKGLSLGMIYVSQESVDEAKKNRKVLRALRDFSQYREFTTETNGVLTFDTEAFNKQLAELDSSIKSDVEDIYANSTQITTDLNNILAARKEEQINKLNADLTAVRASAEKDYSIYDQHTAHLKPYQQKVEAAKKVIEETKAKFNGLSQPAMLAYNKEIVDRELPIRKFNENSNMLRYRHGKVNSNGQCRDGYAKSWIMNNTCYYINHPHDSLTSEAGLNAIKEGVTVNVQLKEKLGQNNWRKSSGLYGELKTAEKALKDQKIIAENKFGQYNTRTIRNAEYKVKSLNDQIARLNDKKSIGYDDWQVLDSTIASNYKVQEKIKAIKDEFVNNVDISYSTEDVNLNKEFDYEASSAIALLYTIDGDTMQMIYGWKLESEEKLAKQELDVVQLPLDIYSSVNISHREFTDIEDALRESLY